MIEATKFNDRKKAIEDAFNLINNKCTYDLSFDPSDMIKKSNLEYQKNISENENKIFKMIDECCDIKTIGLNYEDGYEDEEGANCDDINEYDEEIEINDSVDISKDNNKNLEKNKNNQNDMINYDDFDNNVNYQNNNKDDKMDVDDINTSDKDKVKFKKIMKNTKKRNIINLI